MAVIDAEGAVREWLNNRTDLVGPGGPIPLGAHLTRLRSPGRGSYVYLTRVGGDRGMLAESDVDRARISAQVYGVTKETAAIAANAYASALEGLRGAPVAMGPTVTCLVVDGVTGPVYIDDHESQREQFRYLIDADFYLISAAVAAP